MKAEVFYTGGGIWIAEMDLGNGTYAVVDSDYDTIISIYRYPKDGEEQYMPEDMVFSEDIHDVDLEMAKIYRKLYEALQEKTTL